MAGHLRRVRQGRSQPVALPVFPLRNFTARDLYVRKDGPVKTAADLRGKRVGMYDWVASGSIWYRHFLRFIGVTAPSCSGGSARSMNRASPVTSTRCRMACRPRRPGACRRC